MRVAGAGGTLAAARPTAPGWRFRLLVEVRFVVNLVVVLEVLVVDVVGWRLRPTGLGAPFVVRLVGFAATAAQRLGLLAKSVG